MSLTDPTLPRKLRQGRRPSTLRVIVLLALLGVGGLALGYGWTTFGADEQADPPPLALAGIVAGLPITILASIGWLSTVMRRADIGLGYALAASLIGGGGGVLAAGTSVVASVIGGVLLGAGLLFLVLGLSAARARRQQEVRDQETMRTGTLTTATVSDKGYDFFRESARILATVTFTFTDLQGAQRWVQIPMVIQQASPIADGQETRLWYDPLNPGDTTRIVIELARQSRTRS